MLFAGDLHRPGDHHCYFCGAKCDDTYSAADYIKPTFTNRDSVHRPDSSYVCVGCAMSLGQGEDTMLMIDGTVKQRENARGMQPHLYSWILTADKRLAFTKAHLAIIRDIILHNPPEPPFAIILADSGQKQLVFRAQVAMSKSIFPVMLEEEIIQVYPSLLRERILMATPVVAAIGKPVLTDEITVGNYIAFYKYFGNTDALDNWVRIQYQPISRLAAWLAKNKEDAQNEYPAIKSSGFSPSTGGASGLGA
jgi:hypothetical protein